MASCLLGNGRERKGTMFLRSDEMHYGRAVLTSKWHQAREAEPKDYDMNKADVRDLRKSTYKQIGTISDSLPDSTYTDHFTAKTLPPRQNGEAEKKTDHQIEKELGRSLHATVVMPVHSSAKYPHHYLTTHLDDYRPYGSYTSNIEALRRQKEEEDKARDAVNSAAVRRCLSQFADTTGPRRAGRNTWQDESGVYANSALKFSCHHYAPTYTLMPGGVKP